MLTHAGNMIPDNTSLCSLKTEPANQLPESNLRIASLFCELQISFASGV